MKVKQIIGVMLVCIIVATTFISCSASGTQSSQANRETNGGASTDTSLAVNDQGLAPMADADTPITFKVFVRDPGTAPAKDNPVIAKIQELTGVTIQYEYLVGDLEQKLGVMIAGGDYPDAIFAGDSNKKLIEAGAFIPLQDEIVKYKNLNDMYGSVLDTMRSEDGNTYSMELFAVSDTIPTFQNGGAGFFIQKAVLEEFGYPTVKTIDEYFDLIQKYQEKYPEIDGVKTIGFEVLSDGWRNFCLVNPPQHLLGAGNDGALFVDTTSFETSYYQTSDTAKTYYKKLNEMYKAGVIEAETFTQDYDQYISRLTTGAVLGMFDQYWNFQSADESLFNEGKFERTYVALPIANEGVTDGYLDAASLDNIGTANGIGVTVNCQNSERLLNYFDWLLQREVQDYLQWGEEGTDYITTESGGRVLTDERRSIVNDVAKKRDLTGDPIWYYAPKRQGLYDDGAPCGAGDSEDEFLAKQSGYNQEFLESYGIKYPAELLSDPVKRSAYYPLWAMTIEDGSPAAVTGTKIGDITAKYYPQLALAKDDAEYESIWSRFVSEFDACDIDSLQAEYDRQIALKQGK